MKEIVDAIVKAEKEAKQRVDEARKKARQISADAENSVREKARKLVDDARRQAAEKVQAAKDAARSEKQARIAKGREEISRLRDDKEHLIDEAVEEAFKIVTNVEFQRGPAC